VRLSLPGSIAMASVNAGRWQVTGYSSPSQEPEPRKTRNNYSPVHAANFVALKVFTTHGPFGVEFLCV
jgi:hypothetical protein